MLKAPHAHSIQELFTALETSVHGLTTHEAQRRLENHGPNTLHLTKKINPFLIFISQFKSPLIYILLCAMLLSLFIQEWLDALFILAVLLLNAIIATVQEFSAERTAQALSRFIPLYTRIYRDGEPFTVQAETLVPGDIIRLESGSKVPADIRIIESSSLECDESLLSGESIPVQKHPFDSIDAMTPLSDQINMVFCGSLISRGHGMGVVIKTGKQTLLGSIAQSKKTSRAPLLIRIDNLSRQISYAMAFVVLFMIVISIIRNASFIEIFYTAVALSVSAIPEGLPVALTIALSIGMKRMAKRNVIIRKLVAVESLGSCTTIASDKTGTLTVNELTVKRALLPSGVTFDVGGEGISPLGEITKKSSINQDSQEYDELSTLKELALSGLLTNEGSFTQRQNHWDAEGDSVDIALLVFAKKCGLIQTESNKHYPQNTYLAYNSENAFSAALCSHPEGSVVHIKGAPERLIPYCKTMNVNGSSEPINIPRMMEAVNSLASEGYKVLAICRSNTKEQIVTEPLNIETLDSITLLGFVGIIDPLRSEVPMAVLQCKKAGLKIIMITGDHPLTAYAISKQLGFLSNESEVVTGIQLQQTFDQNRDAFDHIVMQSKVFARVAPNQKMQIIDSLRRQGEFVAVTGDGVNDVPALRAAHVGVAMGKKGTDIAKEASSLILADDNFATIVAGIEEGRIVYENIRKVVYFVISTGFAEVVLFILALLLNVPLPLLPVQLLWLNLVTNGIQDVTLAFEKGEGNELNKPPRKPNEPLFNALMVRRILISGLTMAFLSFAVFYYLLEQHYSIESARNITLLQMVLFENLLVFNARSEKRFVLQKGFFNNPLLLIGVLLAQMVHIAALYTPYLNTTLNVMPINLHTWLALLGIALGLFIIVESHKWMYRKSI